MSLSGGNKTIEVNEHDWLQLKLDIFSLQSQGSERHLRFSVGAKIICFIEDPSVEYSLHKGQKEALKYFQSWVQSTRQQVAAIVEKNCPEVRKSFNPIEDVNFELSYSYGQGSVKVCTFVGEHVQWNI